MRFYCLLIAGWTFLSHGAIPGLTVSRTGSLFFAASDLTTNGIPGLTNPIPMFLVSGVPAESAQGGRLSLIQTQAWSRRYNGAPGAYNVLQHAAVSPEGIVAVAGTSSKAFPVPSYALVTIRYAADGTAQWTNRYESPLRIFDYGCWVGLDASLNAYVVGSIEPAPQTKDLLLLKYAPDGTALWTNRFNQFGTNYHSLKSGRIDPEGNLIVAISANYSHPEREFIAKFNPSGALVWISDFQIDETSYHALNALAVDWTGAPIATGTEYGTIRYSPDGVPLWTNVHTWPQTGVPSDLALDHQGNILVTGDLWRFDPPNPTVRHYTTIKFTRDGTPLWTNRLDTPNYQGGSLPRVLVDARDNVILIGGSTNDTGSDVDFTITKLDADGLLLWQTRHYETNLSGFRLPGDAAVDAAGNIHVIHNTRTPPNTGNDFILLQFSPDGVPLSTNRYHGGGSRAFALSIALDAAGRALVAGNVEVPWSITDFAAVQYVNYLHYTPPPGFVGTDTFTFVATAASGAQATNTVTVTVEADSLWFNLSRSNLRANGDPPRLHLDGALPGRPVVLYASPDLASWTAIATNEPLGGAVEFLIAPAGPRQFYRAAQTGP